MDFLVNSFLASLLFTLAIVVALNFIAGTNTKTKLPPGPIPLPIVGNLFHLNDKPHKSLAKLANTYGPLMSLKLGQTTTVVISSSTLAKEVLQTQDLCFSNRIVVDAVKALDHHESGLPWLPVGPRWRNLRKICNSYIFTSQKLDSNQHLRRKKIQHLLADVEESCRLGKAVNIGQASFKTTLDALSNSMFSLDLSDSKSDIARELKEIVDSIMEEAGKPNLSDYFPVIRRIDLQGIRRRMSINFKKLLDLFDLLIDERLRLRKQSNYISANDMLETLLNISEDSKSEEMDTHRIKHLFLALFAAGTDTTSSTLEWAMAELLRNPSTLSKAKTELEQNGIGKGKILEESDIDKLPYLQAIIKETFRLHPAVPLLLPRKSGADVKMDGFTLPKGAQVLVNVWAIGRDPSLWDDPNSFVPERFLGSDIDIRGRNFELIPFGAGRRICPGLPLAMRLLYLMLGSLINSFDWKLEDGVKPQNMDMEEKFGISLQKAHPLVAVPIQM